MKWIFFAVMLCSSVAFAGRARRNYDYDFGKLAELSIGPVRETFSVRVSGSYVYLWHGYRETRYEKQFGTDTADSNRTFLFSNAGYDFYYVDTTSTGAGKYRIAVMWDVADEPAPTPPPRGYNAFLPRPTPVPTPRWTH